MKERPGRGVERAVDGSVGGATGANRDQTTASVSPIPLKESISPKKSPE